MNQYFVYGILISHNAYLDMKISYTIEDVLKGNDGIRGIFTGRDGDFIIIGEVLGMVEDNNEPYVVPEIDVDEQGLIEGRVYAEFGLEGEFHYYFITNTKKK